MKTLPWRIPWLEMEIVEDSSSHMWLEMEIVEDSPAAAWREIGTVEDFLAAAGSRTAFVRT